jgi:hypothetical protein
LRSECDDIKQCYEYGPHRTSPGKPVLFYVFRVIIYLTIHHTAGDYAEKIIENYYVQTVQSMSFGNFKSKRKPGSQYDTAEKIDH